MSLRSLLARLTGIETRRLTNRIVALTAEAARRERGHMAEVRALRHELVFERARADAAVAEANTIRDLAVKAKVILGESR